MEISPNLVLLEKTETGGGMRRGPLWTVTVGDTFTCHPDQESKQ